MSLTWLDLLIGLFIIGGAIRGFRRGLIREGMAFAGLAVGLILAAEWSPVVTEFLKPFIGGGRAADALAYLMVVLAVLGAATLLTVVTLRLARFLFVGWFDRLGGAIFGSGQGAVLAALVLILMIKFPVAGLDKAVKGSELSVQLLTLVPALVSYLPPELEAVAIFFSPGKLP
jgi:membrane protein required for colicin V production